MRSRLNRNRQVYQLTAVGDSSEKSDKKKGAFDRWTTAITISISIISVVVGLIQFQYAQNIIDIRKYRDAYFEERYKVFKDVSLSISYVQATGKFSKLRMDSVVTRLHKFNYALLVLDERDSTDRSIIDDLKSYERLVFDVVGGKGDAVEMQTLADKITMQLGKTLKDEKEQIIETNSRHWPF